MPLTKADHILGKLATTDAFFNNPAITCWEKQQGKITIYLFAMVYATAEELLAGYKDIRDHVAISFQSQELASSAERWNLYLFYLVAEKVGQRLKQDIEHDKFSTRKIVCSPTGTGLNDEQIAGLIEAELFDFNIEKRKPAATTLGALLNKEFPSVAAALQKLGNADTTEALPTLLNLLSHD